MLINWSLLKPRWTETMDHYEFSRLPPQYRGNPSVSCAILFLFCEWSLISWAAPEEDSRHRWRPPEAAVAFPSAVPRSLVDSRGKVERQLSPRRWTESAVGSVNNKEHSCLANVHELSREILHCIRLYTILTNLFGNRRCWTRDIQCVGQTTSFLLG